MRESEQRCIESLTELTFQFNLKVLPHHVTSKGGRGALSVGGGGGGGGGIGLCVNIGELFGRGIQQQQ